MHNPNCPSPVIFYGLEASHRSCLPSREGIIHGLTVGGKEYGSHSKVCPLHVCKGKLRATYKYISVILNFRTKIIR